MKTPDLITPGDISHQTINECQADICCIVVNRQLEAGTSSWLTIVLSCNMQQNVVKNIHHCNNFKLNLTDSILFIYYYFFFFFFFAKVTWKFQQ